MTAGLRTEYRIFVGLGLALILLGVFEIALDLRSPFGVTVWGIDVGGFALVVCGVSTVLATHWFHATGT